MSDLNKNQTFEKGSQDRAECEAPDEPEVHFSADPDARWVKKGSKSTLGYKAFARTDEEGFIDRVHTTPANRAESPEFAHMIKGSSAQRVLADKAYASRKNRDLLRGLKELHFMGEAAIVAREDFDGDILKKLGA